MIRAGARDGLAEHPRRLAARRRDVAAQRMGVRVPADLSIVVWDDSALCELVHPAFTALRRDIPAAGGQAARMLREAVAGTRPDHFQETSPVLLIRDSTGHPPA